MVTADRALDGGTLIADRPQATHAATVRRGIRFSMVGTVLSSLVQLGAMMIMARLLVPEDYGTYAVAILINALTVGFVLQCFERADFLDGARAPGAAENVLLPLSLGCLSVLIVGLAQAAAVLSIARVPVGPVALALTTTTLAATLMRTRVLLRRHYRFGTLAAMDVAAQCVGPVAIAIALAQLGLGAMAILLGQTAGVLTSAAICLWLNRGRLRFTQDRADFARSARKAGWIGRMIGLEVAHSHAPATILAAAFGPASLGLFNRGFALVYLPLQLLTAAAGRVALSSTRDLSADRERLAAATAKLVGLGSAALAPICGGIAGSAPELTRVILGENFLAATALVPPLALAAWGSLLGSTFAIVAEGAGLIDMKIRVQAANSLLLVLLVGAGALHSMELAVMALAASSLLFLISYGLAVIGHLDRSARDALGWIAPGLAGGALTATLSALLGLILEGPPLVVLCVQVAACAVGVALYYAIFQPGIAREAQLLLRQG